MSVRPEDIAQIDDFLAQTKILSGPPPEFGPKMRGSSSSSWAVEWSIANGDGIVEGGSLRVNHSPASRKPFSIILVHRERCISRLDMVDMSECHHNPLFARSMNLPPTVCGPHMHRWEHNKIHVLAAGLWELPCREPLMSQIKRFEQALPWFSDQINLTLGLDGRQFDLPRELV